MAGLQLISAMLRTTQTVMGCFGSSGMQSCGGDRGVSRMLNPDAPLSPRRRFALLDDIKEEDPELDQEEEADEDAKQPGLKQERLAPSTSDGSRLGNPVSTAPLYGSEDPEPSSKLSRCARIAIRGEARATLVRCIQAKQSPRPPPPTTARPPPGEAPCAVQERRRPAFFDQPDWEVEEDEDEEEEKEEVQTTRKIPDVERIEATSFSSSSLTRKSLDEQNVDRPARDALVRASRPQFAATSLERMTHRGSNSMNALEAASSMAVVF